MDIYKTATIRDTLQPNPYAGRGILIGKTPDGTHAAIAYFIMGRSENSRNRVFIAKGNDVEIRPFDETKVEDPSLIIYYPVRDLGQILIVTNGDQTDTIRDSILHGGTFESALDTRTFEPDAPNWTPRISGICYFGEKNFTYKMSILKSVDAAGSGCVRETFSYPAMNGLGHFLHTYITDGNPLPTFTGEPERLQIPDTLDTFTEQIWQNLHEENRISLYTRFINLKNGKVESRIINRNI